MSRFRVAGRRQEVTAKSQASGIVVLPMEIPLWEGVGVWAGLEQGGGRLPGRLRRRRGQMTETIEDLAACGALCVPVEKADAKAMLQGGAGDTSIPVNEK